MPTARGQGDAAPRPPQASSRGGRGRRSRRACRPAPAATRDPRPVGRHARQADGEAVAEEDLGEGLADDRRDAPALQRLRRVLARRAAAEVAVDHEDPRAFERPCANGWRRPGLPATAMSSSKTCAPSPSKVIAPQEASGDDPIGVDVVARAAGRRRPFDPARCGRTRSWSTSHPRALDWLAARTCGCRRPRRPPPRRRPSPGSSARCARWGCPAVP